jgi:hypothetical protein
VQPSRSVRVPLFRLAATALAVASFGVVAAPATAALPPVGHVFVIVLENKSFVDAFGPPGQVNAPYLNRTLVPMGELLTRYYGVGHNSASNYVGMVSGQPPTPATKNDCPDPLQQVPPAAVPPYNLAAGDGCDYPANFPTIADQLTTAGRTWKGYIQGIPAPCSLLKNNPAPGTHYARKHNPFVLFRSLRDSGQCALNDVPLDGLPADLSSVATTPNLTYIVPDECDDAHTNCTGPLPSNPITDDQYALQQGDAFLRLWVPRILDSPAYKQDGLLIVTFDEGLDTTACCNEQPGPADPNPGSYAAGTPGQGGGDSGTVLISQFISPGSENPGGQHLNTNEYNHYSLLRSLEDLFGIKSHLGYAGQDGLVPFGSDVFDRAPAAAARRSAGCATSPVSITRTSSRAGLSVTGVSTEAFCGAPIRVVQVAVSRRDGNACSWLTIQGQARRGASCARPLWLLARGDGSKWRLSLPRLARGRYSVTVRAIDAAGRRERPSARALGVS